MPRSTRHFTATLLGASLTLALASPTWADPITASSTASTASQSAGSLSNSSVNSSQSSSGKERVSQGRYRVTDVAAAPGEPGQAHVQMIATAPGVAAEQFTLRMPAQLVAQHQLRIGQELDVVERDYGVALALSGERAPFYLLLNDAWMGERANRPVVL